MLIVRYNLLFDFWLCECWFLFCFCFLFFFLFCLTIVLCIFFLLVLFFCTEFSFRQYLLTTFWLGAMFTFARAIKNLMHLIWKMDCRGWSGRAPRRLRCNACCLCYFFVEWIAIDWFVLLNFFVCVFFKFYVHFVIFCWLIRFWCCLEFHLSNWGKKIESRLREKLFIHRKHAFLFMFMSRGSMRVFFYIHFVIIVRRDVEWF